MAWMGLWWLLGLALLVLFVWIVARAAAAGAAPAPPRQLEESPEATLKRRYARGDIDEQEYERRLTNLRK